ncbi:MAG: HslU--HslV peptidase ATPase subunit, partial [Rhodospirillaceae bacterium]|nr:HslU--HslV peptidase ATPase subunit [Rhodospirillaceae bacterium]
RQHPVVAGVCAEVAQARRLHTVMERLLETISFEAADRGGQTMVVDESYVNEHLGELVQDEDLTRYIL